MATTGYRAVTNTTSVAWEHTPADKFGYVEAAGKWVGFFFVSGSGWQLHHYDGTLPASAGDIGGWTSKLATGLTAGNLSMCVDPTRDSVWVLTYSSGAATVQMRRFDYNSGTDSWSTGVSFNLCNSAGVGLGTGSTFRNSLGKLSIRVDSNGVPYVVAGNQGTNSTFGVPGIHIAWPDSAAAVSSTWASINLDSTASNEGDCSGKIAGFAPINSTMNVIVCGAVFTSGGSSESHKIFYHPQETTLANYSSGWSTEIINSTYGVDNHLDAMVIQRPNGEYGVLTCGKDGTSKILLFYSRINNDGSFSHFPCEVTYGTGGSVPLRDDSSRGVLGYNASNDDVWIFYHRSQGTPTESGDYKKTTVQAIIDAASATSVFDPLGPDLGTVCLRDETANGMADLHTASHPFTTAMGVFPVGAQCPVASSYAQWYNFFTIDGPVSSGGGTFGDNVIYASTNTIIRDVVYNNLYGRR